MAGHSRWLAAAVGLLTLAFPAFAEKKASIKIYHPASLGEALAGKRVLMGKVSGNCAEEFAGLFADDLRRHGITVFDRAGVDAVLADHDLRIASLSDPDAAMEASGFLGPSLMFSVEVPLCEARERDTTIEGGIPAAYNSRAESRFTATIHAMDLTNGRELAANTINVDLQKETQSVNGVAEHRGPKDARKMAVQRAAVLAQRMYAPWTETWEVPFRDENTCGLREAGNLLAAGDYEGVVRLSRASTDSCVQNSETAGDAWYDLGVGYMLVQNYDQALSAFEQAQKLHRRRMLKEAILGCQRIKVFIEDMAPLWQNAVVEAQQRAEAQADIMLTNGFIIGLVRGNAAEGDIIGMIAAKPGRFSLAAEDLAVLKKAAVPASVISAMREKQKK
jgi:hypothetical protein